MADVQRTRPPGVRLGNSAMRPSAAPMAASYARFCPRGKETGTGMEGLCNTAYALASMAAQERKGHTGTVWEGGGGERVCVCEKVETRGGKQTRRAKKIRRSQWKVHKTKIIWDKYSRIQVMK